MRYYKCLRTSLMVINIIFAIIAVIYIICNAIVINHLKSEERHSLILYIVLTVLCVAFVMFLYGILGPLLENTCLTWTYTGNMIAILVCTCLFWFVFVINLDENKYCKNQLYQEWKRELRCEDSMFYYQTRLNCCGVLGPEDYTAEKKSIPASCYYNYNTINETFLFETGCLEELTNHFKSIQSRYGWIMFFSVIIELICIIIGVLLARHYQRYYRPVQNTPR
ncbi:protein late bloomer-like isoform X2 [Teleopsis dalmanni]|uniref:protein late bloomer-like isoform X1 n=1 Tax=Teleopsis dalmanni TaxID=139649 RepID=UPI0018CC986F|nr:protein late bloomer-like isoform X1 [Teleopsis dalmanni]XP_037954422.1 protein late bloomer-like isoform X2 [Teleopsis dalmanni]